MKVQKDIREFIALLLSEKVEFLLVGGYALAVHGAPRFGACAAREGFASLGALMSELLWYVAHTRPRCEKKLARYCEREGFAVTLPQYSSVKKYRGKKVVFRKPLFPNYVFLQLASDDVQKVYQSQYVASLLRVPSQEEFEQQLMDILRALESGMEVYLAPVFKAGAKVRVKIGPLRGLEGLVVKRSGATEVILRLDFIAQAAAVRIEATDLEIAD